jgi:iron-sulfur cluster repair protein YtfE (RIC family)
MESAASILEADHAELHDLLRSAKRAIADADLGNAFKATDVFWARLAMHIRAEHLHLFPFVRTVDSDAGEVLDELRRDHDIFMTELARAIKALRIAFHFGNEAETFATVGKLLKNVSERLTAHDKIEEEIVYPIADNAAAPAAETEALARGILKELQNYPPRLRTQK